MIDPDRPPLSALAWEQIEQALYVEANRHWPLIKEFLLPRFTPPSVHAAPRRPLQLLLALRAYAERLFKTEADHYDGFAKDAHYRHWLSRLETRVLARVLSEVDQIDKSDPEKMLMSNGLEHPQMVDSLREMLWELGRDYATGKSPQPPAIQNTLAPQKLPPLKMERPRRMSATIHSPSAAQKMEAFMNSKAMNQKEFSIQAGTTEKTIRKFRQTGRVKRSILDGIASAMGISREKLLG